MFIIETVGSEINCIEIFFTMDDGLLDSLALNWGLLW
jgi:hypothetical protein